MPVLSMQMEPNGRNRPSTTKVRVVLDIKVVLAKAALVKVAALGAALQADDIGDIFSSIFGQRTRPGASNAPIAGEDVSYKLSVDFLEAANGSKKRITLPNGDALDVRIPKGFRDGQSLRLKGKGRPGANGGRPGDALVTVSVKAHPLFEREGDNILVEVPISVDEAVLGAKIAVPTIDGSVTLKVPQNSSSGTILRLKGKGIAGRGDQHVRLKIVLPSETDEKLRAFLEERRGGRSFDPRKDWEKDWGRARVGFDPVLINALTFDRYLAHCTQPPRVAILSTT